MSRVPFFIVVDDPYIKHGLGIFGNEYFGKVILLYIADLNSGRIELIGTEEYSEELVEVLKWFGYKDFTPVFEQLYKAQKPIELSLFEIDVTDLMASEKLKKAFEKLK